MKVRDLIESADTFEPLEPTDDVHERNVAAALHQHAKGNAFMLDLMRKRILVSMGNRHGGNWVHMDSWMKNYGILNTPDNQLIIKRAKAILAEQSKIDEIIHTVPITGNSHTTIEQMVEYILDKARELRADAQELFEAYPKTVTSQGPEDSGYFIKGDVYKSIYDGGKAQFFLVYKQDDILRYADVADKNADVVKEVIEINAKLDRLMARLHHLNWIAE